MARRRAAQGMPRASMPTPTPAERLAHLRAEIGYERISWAGLAELHTLAQYIEPDDVELREAAGLPES